MRMKLSFFGAARNVTGSCYLLEADGTRVLVDCGLYQERPLRSRNWEPLPVPPDSIDAVVLTHAHLDHCGLLPKLAREGFRGRIHCTDATAEIARIILLDSAHLQEEDAAYKAKRHRREGRQGPYPEVPLYTTADAEACLPQFSGVAYERRVAVADGVEATFHDAGHVLGASTIELAVGRNGSRRTILFSGDLGRWDTPIIRDPTVPDRADYVVVESTYGNRCHEDRADIPDRLAEVINETVKRGGNVVVPSFALERAQELLYYLGDLRAAKRIPRLMVFVDSPMAINVTEVFRHHPELYDREMRRRIDRHESPFEFPGLTMTRDTWQSKAINSIKGTVVIIAGSGMCTGGRVKHHLVRNITRRASTVLFVGYQAAGTLGRLIVDGRKEVRILGKKHRVRARVERVQGFSAHADRDELFRWLSSLTAAPRHVFVTHGEEESALSFGRYVHDRTGWETSVPTYKDEASLD